MNLVINRILGYIITYLEKNNIFIFDLNGVAVYINVMALSNQYTNILTYITSQISMKLVIDRILEYIITYLEKNSIFIFGRRHISL